MITPPFVKPGDTIGIVSTARKISKQKLLPALELLDSWGLKAILGHTIGAEDHQFAGDDGLRTKDFQAMLDNPNIKVIWCARGGYGTVRMLDKLDFTNFKQNPKWIAGYSDITVLHSHVHSFGIETLHAQMPLEIEKRSGASRESLRKALFGELPHLSTPSIHEFNRIGKATAPLVGGNLSVLYSLCGSPTSLDTRGKILFIEDLDEYLYHIDRMLQNLKRNGMINDLAGLIAGGFTKMHDNSIPFGMSAEEIIHELVAPFDYPVCYGFPAGHIEDNRALIFGRKVNLEVSDTSVNLRF